MPGDLVARAWAVILLAGLGTYAVRVLFFALADRLTAVPPTVGRALSMIPPAVLAAVVASTLFHRHGVHTPAVAELVAALLAAAVAWRTKSILFTLVVGMAALLVLEQVL